MNIKKKFFNLLNYKVFQRKSTNEKLDWLIETKVLIEVFKKSKNCLNSNTDPFILELQWQMIFINNKIYNIEYKNKEYRISDILIEEIQKSLYSSYLEQRDNNNELYFLELEIRKKINVDEKIKTLEYYYENYISDVHNDDVLDFLQENNFYALDKKQFLKSDFNNDINFYDYDYIYYSLIYNNADFIFKYLFNENWDFEKQTFLSKMNNLYTKKKIIKFCLSKLAELKGNSSSTINQKLTSNQIVFLLEEIRNINDDVWENLHDTKKADLISYITYYTRNTIREKLPNLKKSSINLSNQENADLDLVQSIVKKIVEGR